MKESMYLVELLGGHFDGMRGAVKEICVTQGTIVISECPRHGFMPTPDDCSCGDRMWYLYELNPKSTCRFVVLGKET